MATYVEFDGESVDVAIVSDTIMRANTPAGVAPGPVDVKVVTDHGEATLTDAFVYLADGPNLELTIPASVPVVVDEATTYTTRLTNYGAESPPVTEEIRLSNEAGDLTADDVVYETQDVGGVWNSVTWTEDAGDLVVTYTYTHIHEAGDQSSDVRLTVTRDTGDITGTSTYTLDEDDSVLAQATYTYEVTEAA